MQTPEPTAANTECRFTPAWQPGADSNLQRAGKQPSAAQDRERGLLSAVTMARRFHELYEELAPACGYETREETRVQWPELPADNRRLMISVCMLILAEMREEGALRDGEPF